jgi:hypothetical protein
MLVRTSLLASLIASAIAACGGGADDLDPDVVTTLPPGDATGSAATGTYAMESITTGCSGTCAIEVDGFTYSACDIGTRLDELAEVVQADGALTIDIDDSDYVSRLSGGLFADGSFDVGGLRTQQGGQVTITARSAGTLVGAAMTGTARLHVTGMGLDCRIEAEVTGAR